MNKLAKKPITVSKSDAGDELKRRSYDILEATHNNDTQDVKSALAEAPECINDKCEETGMTALHFCGANRNLEIAKVLFEQDEPKVNPWIKDKWDRLAIDIAHDTGNQSLIDLIQRHMFPEDYDYDFDVLDKDQKTRAIKLSPKFDDAEP